MAKRIAAQTADRKLDKPWVRTIRRETGLIEHVCKCGVGHPAKGSVLWMKLNGIDGMGVHGCDGCCSKPEWIIADLTEGIEVANELLFKAMQELKRKKELE